MSKEIKKHYSKLGKKGGAAIKKKYGKKHFSEIGKKGGWPKGKKRKPEKEVKKPVVKKKAPAKRKTKHDDDK